MLGNVRYLHGETLGRWRTADLLIGLVYLSQRGYEESPAADLASHGQVVGRDLDAVGRRKLAVCASVACSRSSLLPDAAGKLSILPGMPCSQAYKGHETAVAG